MQEQQSSAQDCPGSRKSPCFQLLAHACALVRCPRLARALMSSEQPGGGGLGKSEMEDFPLLPVSRLPFTPAQCRWPSQAGRRCLEGSGRRGVSGKGGQEGHGSLRPELGRAGWLCHHAAAENQTSRQQIFPLLSNKSKIPFCFHSTAAVLRGSSWNQVPPCKALLNLKVTEPLSQGLQPNRTRQTKLTSVLLSK